MNERDEWIDRQRRQQRGARWAMLIVVVALAAVYAVAALVQYWGVILHALTGWL